MTHLAIIGGSGLYGMSAFKLEREVVVTTPYGSPSAPLRVGTLNGVPIVFLARHGDGHVLSPTHLNYRANIWALKSVGVRAVYSVSAVGSLRDEIKPGHMVIVNQFIDMTKRRESTFFGEDIVAHVSFAKPVSSMLARHLVRACHELELLHHTQATYLCIEGPQFSTEAESHLWRQWGAHVVGMTNVTEAKLCREAEIDYATLALSTDYDCWHPDHDSVTTEQIIQVLHANIHNAQQILLKAVAYYNAADIHDAADALKNAILTQKQRVSRDAVNRYGVLVQKYF